MKTYKEVWLRFKEYAKFKGYTKKDVGGESFQNSKGHTLRLKSCIKDRIRVWEEGVGYYEISNVPTVEELKKLKRKQSKRI